MSTTIEANQPKSDIAIQEPISLGWSKGHDYYTKGHIDKQLFIDGMLNCHPNEQGTFDINRVRHEYWRFVPDSAGDYASLVFKEKEAYK